MARDLVAMAWSKAFQRANPVNDAECALFHHLVALVDSRSPHPTQSGSAGVTTLLEKEIQAKQAYMDPSWGYIDISNIGTSLQIY
jgi:hypothetical protein